MNDIRPDLLKKRKLIYVNLCPFLVLPLRNYLFENSENEISESSEKNSTRKKDEKSTAPLITWNSLCSHQLKQGSLVYCGVSCDF